MRDLLDRLGCALQLGIGVGAFALFATHTTLPIWGSALLAAAASVVGTWLLVFVVGRVVDAVG